MNTLSCRARGVIAYGYNDFPVLAGQLDLRGDNMPALAPTPLQIHHDLADYGDVAGDAALRARLAELFGVGADQVLITAGGSEALSLALLCIADPGAPVHIPRPAFPGFEQLAGLLGLSVVSYPVPGPVPVRGRTPLVVCTPHNPTGLVTAPCGAGGGDGWVIWDLSHTSPASDLLTAFTTELGPADIVVYSLSKLLRLPGARVGCLIATDLDLIAAASRAKTHLSMSTSQPGQHAALRVLRNPETAEELARRTARLAARRKRIMEAIGSSQSLRADPALDGTHLYVHTHDGSDAWQRLQQAGVVGIPGPVFHGQTSAVRLCIAQPSNVIDQAATRIQAL
ncbi:MULTISPECIES: pyridoxal phosphate-dependent aminotransferase [Nocardia]|uniref:Aspartate aminotransferase n=1 Tax=Nocardia africana TaxID=134964 RepID=A0A378X7A8_9NOCA|nr:pyridoxal phosphate-dependent aminotransferase [Nocardia africana]MCC3317891.1 pyridoxal phosphate-dependent aminotransferase [Nocardia africana]SUA48665.1 Aspartate aminotransferase [Nocardia africana]